MDKGNLHKWALQVERLSRSFLFYFYSTYQEDEVRVYPEKRKESVAFVQSNFEPDIGLRGVFECDDTKLH